MRFYPSLPFSQVVYLWHPASAGWSMQAVPRPACPAWQDSRPTHRTGAVDYTGWDAAPSGTSYVSGPTARWGPALPGLLRSGSADSGR